MAGVMSTPMTRPSGPTCSSGQESVEPTPGAQVEHGLSRLQVEVRDGRAAAQAEVRSLRHRLLVFLLVADL